MLYNCDAGEDTRVFWTARISNQSVLKEIKHDYSLKGLALKLQYLGHLMQRADSLEQLSNAIKTLNIKFKHKIKH